MTLTDQAGLHYEADAERLLTAELHDYPGGPAYRLYLRRCELGAFMRSGRRAYFIPCFMIGPAGLGDHVFGNFVIGIREGRLSIGSWVFSLEMSLVIQSWCQGHPHEQLSLEVA